MNKISEEITFSLGGMFADIGTAKTTAYVDMSGARQVAAHCVTGNIAEGATLTVQLRQATDSAGTGAKNLGTATVVESEGGGTTGESVAGLAEAFAEDLDTNNGFTHVAATVTASAGTPAAGVSLVRGGLRFSA